MNAYPNQFPGTLRIFAGIGRRLNVYVSMAKKQKRKKSFEISLLGHSQPKHESSANVQVEIIENQFRLQPVFFFCSNGFPPNQYDCFVTTNRTSPLSRIQLSNLE